MEHSGRNLDADTRRGESHGGLFRSAPLSPNHHRCASNRRERTPVNGSFPAGLAAASGLGGGMGGPGAVGLPLDHSCVDGGAGVAGLAAWMRFGQACARLTEALGASVPCAVPPAVSHAAAGGGAGGALDESCIDGSLLGSVCVVWPGAPAPRPAALFRRPLGAAARRACASLPAHAAVGHQGGARGQPRLSLKAAPGRGRGRGRRGARAAPWGT